MAAKGVGVASATCIYVQGRSDPDPLPFVTKNCSQLSSHQQKELSCVLQARAEGEGKTVESVFDHFVSVFTRANGRGPTEEEIFLGFRVAQIVRCSKPECDRIGDDVFLCSCRVAYCSLHGKEHQILQRRCRIENVKF